MKNVFVQREKILFLSNNKVIFLGHGKKYTALRKKDYAGAKRMPIQIHLNSKRLLKEKTKTGYKRVPYKRVPFAIFLAEIKNDLFAYNKTPLRPLV